ncbi:MAG: 6-bladed beta-propeller [Bacteroidetes bacterium]|nr:MAG: 6-bladed beta-propeller [Bacteroidota bacterium]
MNKLSVLLFFGSALAFALLASGCGSSREMESARRYIWPEPPDSPRVEYINTLRGESDFSSGIGGFFNALSGGAVAIKFSRPFDICLAGEERYYVTDATNGVILYDTKKKTVEAIGERSTIDLKEPRGIAYAHGKLFIGLASSKKIAVLNDNGEVIRAIGRDGKFQNPIDIVCDSLRNRIYIVDIKQHKVFAYTEDGDSLFTIGKRGEGNGEFNYPQSAAVDANGNLYVVDGFNFRIAIFDTNGTYLRQFGSQGDVYGSFARPKGIALDSYGNIYVLDGVHQNFQIFNNAGELLMFVGKFSYMNDGFQNPVSIAIDGNNRIFVTDNLNSRVQVFQLLKGD